MEKVSKDWQDNTQDTTLVDIIYQYTRHWKLFILSILVCLTIGTAVVMTTQRQYKSTISLLLKEDKNKMGGASSGMSLDELGLLSTTNNIDNEMAILRSPDLMRGVIDSLNLATSYRVREGFRYNELYKESPFLVTYSNKALDFLGEISFEINKNEKEFSIEGKYTLSKDQEIIISKQVYQLPDTITLPDNLGYINISLTGQKINENQSYYVSILSPVVVARDLGSVLSVVQTSKSSSALSINLLTNNTFKGAAILKELVRQYNVQNVKVNNQIAYNTAIFINDRLKEIAVELSDVERDVVDYKQAHSIADLSSEAQLSIQKSGQNEERLMDIETQLNVINMVDRFVLDPSNELKIIPNLGVSDPALAQVINEYNTKLLNSESLLKSTGEENPMRKRIMEDITNIRSGITSSLRNVKQSYEISKQDLRRMSGSTMYRIQSIPLQEKGLLERVRQQQVKESLFLFLMQKREETNISIASISDKARIIASPQMDVLPVAPKAKMTLLVAFILGLLIPVFIIYVQNLLRTKVSNRSDLERLSKISVIGQINYTKSKDPLIVKSDPKSDTAELFRSLRNNLNFILKNRDHKIIMVTSTLTEEGKSFVSVNLAITYLFSNKKVLLIGGDIRKPKLKKYLGLSGSKGLSDYLSSDDNWHNYIIKTDLSTDFDVMISGVIPPNPNELLMTPKLKTFLLEAKREYDLVVLDTAPVGMVSDTYLFDEHIDVTLYVVRENVTPKDAINFVNMQKEQERLQNMYIVFNGSSLDNYSGYKYGYGKKYGYQ